MHAPIKIGERLVQPHTLDSHRTIDLSHRSQFHAGNTDELRQPRSAPQLLSRRSFALLRRWSHRHLNTTARATDIPILRHPHPKGHRVHTCISSHRLTTMQCLPPKVPRDHENSIAKTGGRCLLVRVPTMT